MATTAREFVRGRPEAPRAELVVGFLGLVAATVVATVLANGFRPGSPVGEFLAGVALPLVVFYAPGVVAAVGGYLRCGLPACLALGLVPASFVALAAAVDRILAVPGFGGGDAPLVSIALVIATVGVVSAALGYLLGTAGQLGVTVARERSAVTTDEER